MRRLRRDLLDEVVVLEEGVVAQLLVFRQAAAIGASRCAQEGLLQLVAAPDSTRCVAAIILCVRGVVSIPLLLTWRTGGFSALVGSENARLSDTHTHTHDFEHATGHIFCEPRGRWSARRRLIYVQRAAICNMPNTCTRDAMIALML